MAGWDIFLSYDKSNVAIAKELAEAFQARGWSVWWDPKIPPGRSWAEVIESSIKSSKCVVVLWSAASVKSKWVKKEARFADKLERLIPAIIEPVELPFEFDHIEAAHLENWQGSETDEFAELVAELRSRILAISAVSNVPSNEIQVDTANNIASEVAGAGDGTESSAPKGKISLETEPVGSSSRQIGSKVEPDFWYTKTGRLLAGLAAVTVIWILGLSAVYALTHFAMSLHFASLDARVLLLTNRVPWLANSIGVIVGIIIITSTWSIVFDEFPLFGRDYLLSSLKAMAVPLGSAFCVALLLGSSIQTGWMRHFGPIAVTIAAITAQACAILNELI